MIFISAQPDQIYFIWQLEIQLRNLASLGIKKHQVQVLIGFDPKKGVKKALQHFMIENDNYAQFYTYPDQRKDPKYTSSIRPHILKQHFRLYPELQQETLFYHDSDILFSRIPNIHKEDNNQTCYVSDTRRYLDVNYIRRVACEQLLDDMLKIIGLSKEKLEQENHQAGGAQYILKGTTSEFWGKVEENCEALYILMNKYNTELWEQRYPRTKEYKSKKIGIQSWCADMWAVLWNLWLYDKKVEIHAEMAFSWPYSPIKEWEAKAIQHYSGNIKEKDIFFKKNEYVNFVPWYDDTLQRIPKTNCSYKIVELIRSRKNELDQNRPVFNLYAIVIDSHASKGYEEAKFQIIKKYYQKYLAIDVYLDCTYSSLQIYDLKKYSGTLTLPMGCILDCRIIQSIFESSMLNNTIIFSFKRIYRLDQLFVEAFSKVLDVELLTLNHNKLNCLENPSLSIRFVPTVNTLHKKRETEKIKKKTLYSAYML
ncbi:hypothetical protein H8S90_24535 [Olivibacter sp. SDN3]|uniref:hypothetical protein n=1 Tax=Olivibacter sp. SDN3 TaxID=2764720 RepID=UPI0016512E58|nr:hypothetical protein [Olivibacter sp. SDN3]QNL49829.1 hypothetical protein H8S90_24535 [Olivibacter sp. SDN3]